MRNYELIQEIHETCLREPDIGSGEIVSIIELHRPEIAGKLPTHESLMEEMRKYPHRDNHMD
tara:strand:+ start:249 stop:434 length:186 start_codon:yes stop_codon:yes gene_type:complete